MPDFYFTGDDYRYRFDPEAKQRFLDLLRERFNSGAMYDSRTLKWDTIVERKAVELARHLLGEMGDFSFLKPAPILGRDHEGELRLRILALTQSKAKNVNLGKSTLHYLRRWALSGRSIRLQKRTLERLNSLGYR